MTRITEQDHSGTDCGNGDIVIVPGENLAAKLIWIYSNAQSNGNYVIELNADESIGSEHSSLSYDDKSNITITLKGIDSNRTISLSSKGELFKIDKGVTLILDNNITLRGRNDNDKPLVSVSGALVMNSGSAITDNINEPDGVLKPFAGAGGVHVWKAGTFTMNGGIISGNSSSGGMGGGGVNVSGSFVMKGGIISGNTSTVGGGVYILGCDSTGTTFIKTGGTITGYASDTINGNVTIIDGRICDYSWAIAFGHAIVCVFAVEENGHFKTRCKDTTTGPTDNMSYTYGNFTGVWDGKTEPSTSESSSSGNGCYIATCVYGSYDCPEVWTLRRFRDSILSGSWFGRCFISIYYAVGSKIVELFGNKKWFNRLWKPILDKFVNKLQNSGVDSTYYSGI